MLQGIKVLVGDKRQEGDDRAVLVNVVDARHCALHACDEKEKKV